MNLSIAALEKHEIKRVYTSLRKNLKISYYSKINEKRVNLRHFVKARAEKRSFLLHGRRIRQLFNQEGFGCLRAYQLLSQAQKIFISQLRKFVVSIYVMEIRFLVKYDLRKKNERYFGFYKLKAVNGDEMIQSQQKSVCIPALTPLYPDRQMKLERNRKSYRHASWI